MISTEPAPSPAPPSPTIEPETPVKSIALTPEILTPAGLTDLQPGQEVTLRVSGSTENGVMNFEVVSKTPNPELPSPSISPEPADDGDEEEKMLGYKRPKAEARPFPAIKGLRS